MLDKNNFSKKGYQNENGKIVYDPVDNNYGNMIICNNFFNADEMKDLIFGEKCIQDFFNTIFSDTKPDEPIVGLQMYNLTLADIKNFNFKKYSNDVLVTITNIYRDNNGFFPPHLHNHYRGQIINIILSVLRSNSEFAYLRNNHGTYTPNIIQLSRKETSEIIGLCDSISHRNSKITMTNYEVKFAYKTRIKPVSKDDHPVFIDSEGLCHIIEPIENSSYEEGIYIVKITNESPQNIPYIKLPLPTNGNIVKSEMLCGVFISTLNEFKFIYKERYKTSFDEAYANDCIYNIKKLVGNYLYDTVTETSHGIITMVKGFSLSRKQFFTCSPHEGVCEIENVTPDRMKKEEFLNTLTEFGLSYELLVANDYIIRKTNICSGSGNVAPLNFRYDKIKLGRKTGLNELKGSLFDSDLALFTETGMAIFATKEAAERCMIHSGGDFHKYVHYIYNKISQKGEKHAFMDSIKNAILLGAGAAVPKFIEMIISSSKKGSKGEKMSIMKVMHPPIASTIISSFIPGFSKVNQIFSIINKGVSAMEFVTIVKTVSAKVFGTCSKVKTEIVKYSHIVFGFVKNIAITTFGYILSILNTIKGGFKVLIDPSIPIATKLRRFCSGVISIVKGAFTFAVLHVKNIIETSVNLIKKAADTVVCTVKFVVNFTAGFINKVANFIGGFFNKGADNITKTVTTVTESIVPPVNLDPAF